MTGRQKDESGSTPESVDHQLDEVYDYTVPVPFRVAWRGYDRFQVDEHIRRLQRSAENAAAPSETPGLQEGFLTQPPQFDVVIRGYDRREVDAFLQGFPR